MQTSNRFWNGAIIIASALVFSTTFFFISSTDIILNKYNNSISKSEKIDSEFEVENPQERYEQEFMRLRDPETNQLPENIFQRERNFILTNFGRKNFLKTQESGFNWICRGPVNLGGRTRALAFDVDNDSTILAGSVTGDMWRSTNLGEEWQRLKTPPLLPNISCIAQDTRPGKHNIWYYGTGETALYSLIKTDSSARRSYPSDGICKSTDGGNTWFQLLSTVSKKPHLIEPFDFINKIVIDNNNKINDVVLASTIGGIMRSNDGGASWNLVLGDSSTNTEFTDIVQTNDGIFYASISKGKYKGIYGSTDGTKWEEIAGSFMPDTCGRIVLATAQSNPKLMFALITTTANVKNGNNTVRVEAYKLGRFKVGFDSLTNKTSFNNGIWDDLSVAIPKRNNTSLLNSQNGYNLLLAIKPDNEQTIFMGATNLYVNTNAGSSVDGTMWLGGYDPQNGSYSIDDPTKLHPDLHGVIFFPNNPNAMIVICDGGIRFTMDNTQNKIIWGAKNSGYITGQFYSVGLDHETIGSPTLVGALQDNGCWAVVDNNPNALWNIMNSADGMHAQVIDSGRQFLVAMQGGRVSRANSNKSPKDNNHRVFPDSAQGLFINPFATDPSDRRVIYLPMKNSLYRKLNVLQNDSNKNWKKIWWGADFISGIGVSYNNPSNRVYFGTTNGKLFRIDNAIDTVNQDLLDEVELKSTLFPKGGWINHVAVDPQNGDNAIVVFSNYNKLSLFYTTDAGLNWVSVGGNLEEFPDGSGAGPSCRNAAFLSHPEKKLIFVATSAGLYSTNKLDGDKTVWNLEGVGTPLEYAVCEAIDIRQSDGFVAVATHGKGVFSGKSDIKSVNENSTLRNNINIVIAPNVIKDKAMITIQASNRAMYTVSLYDLNGKLCKYFYEGVINNKFELPIDCSFFPNGNYNIVVKSKNGMISKKIIIAK